jgi:allophanate hydrolase subunit 1
MKFFIPDVNDEQLAVKTYQAIITFAKDTLGWNVSNRKIFQINYKHNSEYHEAEVGKNNDTNGEKIIAILESNAYLVCTPSRGVIRGMPILVGIEEIFNIIDFEESA